MLARLAKLAARGAQLREAVLQKKAGIIGGALRVAAKNPLMTGMTGLAGVSGVQGAAGKYRETKAGFDPAVQQVMLGRPPTPPGATR